MTETNPFFINLAKSTDESEARKSLRICGSGLFVSENSISLLTKSYERWIKSQTGKEIQKSTDKYLKKFFNSEEPKTYYLIDGKECLVGYIASETENIFNELKPSETKVPRYHGELLDPEWFLHPKDPIFSKLRGVTYESNSSKGSSISFEVKNKKIKLSTANLNRFMKKIKEARVINHESIRDALNPLAKILNQAKASPTKYCNIIPKSIVKKSPSLNLKWKTLSIILDKDNFIVGCFSNAGKAYRDSIDNEILSLQTKPPLTSVKSFTVSSSSMKIKAHGMSLKLSQAAFSQYMRLLKRKKLKKGDQRFLSIKSVITKLVNLIHKSGEPNEELLKELLDGQSPRNKMYRVNGNWVFVIRDRSEITSCFRLNTNKKDSNQKNSNRKDSHQKDNHKKDKDSKKRPNPLNENQRQLTETQL